MRRAFLKEQINKGELPEVAVFKHKETSDNFKILKNEKVYSECEYPALVSLNYNAGKLLPNRIVRQRPRFSHSVKVLMMTI